MIDITGYWTFFCNPKIWQIDLFLNSGETEDTFKILDWQKDYFAPGQLGIVRVGIDRRTKNELNGRNRLKRGIYAIVEVLSFPDHFPESQRYYLYFDKSKHKNVLRVKIKYLKNLLLNPIPLEILKDNPITSTDDYLINGFQGSAMPLKEEVFHSILQMVNDESIFEKHIIEQATTTEELIHLEKKYQNATPEIRQVVSKRIERGKISKEVKRLNGYKCQVCEALGLNPLTFKKKNGDYYIETHHIIPVSEQNKGSLGFSNLITVCPNHHRQLHFGDVFIVENKKDRIVFLIDNKKVTIRKILFRKNEVL